MKEAKEIVEIFNCDPELPALTPGIVRTLYMALYSLDPNKERSGICSVLIFTTTPQFSLLKAIFTIWPEFSGVNQYPIKCPAYLGLSPSEAYFFFSRTSSMWHRGAIYGAARRRLWSFCLSVLEDLLQYYRVEGTYTLSSSK